MKFYRENRVGRRIVVSDSLLHITRNKSPKNQRKKPNECSNPDRAMWAAAGVRSDGLVGMTKVCSEGLSALQPDGNHQSRLPRSCEGDTPVSQTITGMPHRITNVVEGHCSSFTHYSKRTSIPQRSDSQLMVRTVALMSV